jgi:putative membrane protein
MFELMARWLLSGVVLLLVAKVVPGFYVGGAEAGLIAAGLIGLLNAVLGQLLKPVAFPWPVLTFGALMLASNALFILATSKIVNGFDVYAYNPAFWGAAVMAALAVAIRAFVKET